MATRRRSATPDADDQTISSGAPASPISPPRHDSLYSPSTTLCHPSPSTTTTHSRSMSSADVVKEGKRLSLHFPVQPQPQPSPQAGSTSPRLSPARSRPGSWITPIASPPMVTSPTETNFLTVLAAQERRVLELKDELSKAEQELVDLKKQYWKHEGNKKRNDLHHVTQLQPLNTTLANLTADPEDEDGGNLWMQKEMERRKALLNNTKTSQRKVFSGSRHTRTLSLLSPDKVTYTPSFPQPHDLRQSLDETKRQSVYRNSSPDDIASQIAKIKDDRYDLSNIQRDILLQTGKRVATDLKDGLMTFLEDLRQATVGDEAAHPDDDPHQKVKKQPSKGNVNGRPPLNRAISSSKKHSPEETDLIDISESFWKENGLDEPKAVESTKVMKPVKKAPTTKALEKTPSKTPANSSKKTAKKPSPKASTKTPKKSPVKSAQKTPVKATQKTDAFEESWDTWDTPQTNATESSDESESEGSGNSSPRTSTSSTGLGSNTPDASHSNTGSIPWPDLIKLSPNNLKRTASHLMKEWEKSLTPPAEAREGSHVSGDYIGRSASPAGKK